MIDSTIADLAIAALAGLAVGIEREWSGHAAGPDARFAGVRTFLLLGIVGGAAGWFASHGLAIIGVALLAGGAALAVTAYAVAARRGPESIDGTTEAAALVVLALGALAGMGERTLASGAAAVVVLALMEKARAHRLVQHVGEKELRSTLQFAVMSLVILPLLPTTSYGPYGGVQPRALWTVVLIFTGLNFAGYLARKGLGAERGWAVAGFLGGLISSTSVALVFSRRSRDEPELSGPLALGIVAACTVLLVRVIVLTTVLERSVAAALVPYLLLPFLVGSVMTALALMRSARTPNALLQDQELSPSPLRLASALKMALAFQGALWAVFFVRERWGTTELLASAAALGFTDVDALTVSMSKLGSGDGQAEVAALAIAVGVIANTVLKLGLVLGFGSPILRRYAGTSLAALGAASGFGIWMMNR